MNGLASHCDCNLKVLVNKFSVAIISTYLSMAIIWYLGCVMYYSCVLKRNLSEETRRINRSLEI